MNDDSPNVSIKPLGKIATLRRGITYSADMLVERDLGIPYINMKSFKKGGGFNKEGLKYFSGPHVVEDLAKENDLLIANTDVTLDGDIVGIPAYLPVHIRKNPVLFSHHVTRLRLENEINSHFLYYLLNTEEYRRWMHKYARGTTVLMLDMNAIKRIPIRYPATIKVQTEVVRRIEIIDYAIEKTEALIKKYQNIKVGLMHDLFTRGITADGKLRPPREEAPELYQETPIGWISKDWNVIPLGQISDITSGVTLTSKVTPDQTIIVPYLRVANVQDGYLDLSEIKEIKVNKKTFINLLLQPGDVLMNEGGDFDKLGRGTVWQGEIEQCIHQNHVFRVRTDKNILRSFYLAYWSESNFGKKYFILSSKQSTNLASINSTQLKAYPIGVPDDGEQIRIEERIDSINSKIQSLKDERNKLSNQKSGLMHDLLTGEVEVKVDEPEAAHV
ncbi:MAG: restriction endonuclease subunit S [Gammaproteobacteria bacterium]|nr:restriction endonuclease subunit S [Gammaproteobacteria bacterium]